MSHEAYCTHQTCQLSHDTRIATRQAPELKTEPFFGVQPAVPCYIISLQDILCVSMTWRNRTKEPRASMKPCSCSCSSWQYHNVFVTGLQDLLSFLNKMVKWKIHTMLEAFRYILNCWYMVIGGCQPSRESKGITLSSPWLYPRESTFRIGALYLIGPAMDGKYPWPHATSVGQSNLGLLGLAWEQLFLPWQCIFLAMAMQRAEILIYLQLHSGDQYILNANRSKTFSDNVYKLFPFHKKLVNVCFFIKTAFCNINVESNPNNLLPVRAKLPKHIMWKGSCLLLFQRSTGFGIKESHYQNWQIILIININQVSTRHKP